MEQKTGLKMWTRNLIMFAIVMFLTRFGQGLLGGARMVFFVDTFKLSSGQVLWLEGIRELPGLALIFIAALTMRLPLKYQAALAVVLMGIGYALFAFVGSYAALLGVVINRGGKTASYKGDSIVHANGDPGFDELKSWFYDTLSGVASSPDDEYRKAFRKFLDSPHRVIIET